MYKRQGYEELYVLNTDTYAGNTQTSDRLYDRDSPGVYTELFALPANANSANYVAGRSCACVDRTGSGRYGVMVANYGGPMRLFERQMGTTRTVIDVAPSAGGAMSTYRRLVAFHWKIWLAAPKPATTNSNVPSALVSVTATP